jgi:hypothetical protein
VPIDEEQPDFALAIKEEAQRTLQEKIVSSGLGGLLHHSIPVVGPAVVELMNDLAIQRTNKRMYDMFEYFTNKIRDIGEEKIDREWFRSEEFQTLLFEALRQLHVTHDRQKIEMLGVALANSGAPGFKDDERKELFIRFVRDLTLQHIKMLVELAPKPLELESPLPLGVARRDELTQQLNWARRRTLTPMNDDLLALQMLHAYGLVEENLKSSIEEPSIPSRASESQIRDAVRKFSKSIENAKVTRSFRLSPLGDRFLKFMGLPKPSAPVASVRSQSPSSRRNVR